MVDYIDNAFRTQTFESIQEFEDEPKGLTAGDFSENPSG